MKQLELKRNSGKSLYQQIYTELRAQIFRGDISAGELLPSYRFMSRKYQVNVSTVQKAYDLLETNGYIERRHGSGCFVLPLDSFEFFADGVMLDSVEEGQSESENVIDFATSTPMAGQEETADFIRLINELAEQRPHALFCYPPTRGVPALIEVIHRRLVESGMSVGEENIHIVGGSQQGIDLICKSLINKNTVILTEDPSYCRKIMRWNLPANPIDLEQREGRINRYLCHAIRQNLAESEYGNAPFSGPVWPEILRRAVAKLKPGHSDLIPFWCLPDDFPFTRKIERIVPMYPYSQDHEKYNRLLEVLSLYRLTLGQPRQEELLDTIKKSNWDLSQLKRLYINLSPYTRLSKL